MASIGKMISSPLLDPQAAIGQLFGGDKEKAKTPEVGAPPAASNSQAALAAQSAAAEEERRRRAGAGAASTTMTGPLGLNDNEEETSARRVLLG